MSRSFFRLFFVSLLLLLPAAAFQLPPTSTQVLVGIGDGWNSNTVSLRFYEKDRDGWKPVGEAWKARLGKSGMVWGKGLNPVPKGATTKAEGDNRSPAGVFSLGGAWGYDASIRKHPRLPYRQITPRDLWVEDPKSPSYNRNVILDHDPATAWEKKQQMRQGDAAHSLKLFIAHNAPPNVTPGAGSSIFFHIWRRGGEATTAGCTTMEKPRLQWLIARLDPNRRPLYVLLPKAEYEQRRADWKLP